MKEIREAGKLYSILVRRNSLPKGTTWYGPEDSKLQACSWRWEEGKTFKIHKHLRNERYVMFTQEAMVVTSGELQCNIKTDLDKVICISLFPGDMIVHYAGGHGYEVLRDDTQCYEIKLGPAPSMLANEDKEYI